jgi:hypothetical protein
VGYPLLSAADRGCAIRVEKIRRGGEGAAGQRVAYLTRRSVPSDQSLSFARRGNAARWERVR